MTIVHIANAVRGIQPAIEAIFSPHGGVEAVEGVVPVGITVAPAARRRPPTELGQQPACGGGRGDRAVGPGSKLKIPRGRFLFRLGAGRAGGRQQHEQPQKTELADVEAHPEAVVYATGRS